MLSASAKIQYSHALVEKLCKEIDLKQDSDPLPIEFTLVTKEIYPKHIKMKILSIYQSIKLLYI